MLLGRTKPLRSAWLIWSVLASLSAASNLAEGAGDSAWFVCVQAGATLLVFVLSFRFGTGSFVRSYDGAVLALALVGLGLWWLTHTAIYALAISIAVSALGGWVTISKAYKAPETETASCWILSVIASAMAIVSVGSLDPVLLAYPAYLLVLYLGILTAIFLGRQRGAAPVSVLQRNRASTVVQLRVEPPLTRKRAA
ncbi:hypothetical protein [Thalassococcus lentus]|uniref:Uncharacterized protein n=1 Tax=Thalassococcus lentus TaxID=1210524 RepID=A0ABT4XMF4_9RHOB|nr:hypothetical protein [Thalassococcus lentus]MDA7423131.1 hypothetical protein [Thalassococcus lentus]